MDELYGKTLNILEEKKGFVEAMAQALLAKEVLNLEELTSLLGERPFKNDQMRNIDKYVHGFKDGNTMKPNDVAEDDANDNKVNKGDNAADEAQMPSSSATTAGA